MVLLALLIKRNFSENALAKLPEHLIDAFLNVLASLVGLCLDPFGHLVSLVLLCGCKVVDGLWLCRCASVHELVAGHLKHKDAVLGKMVTEVVLQHEEVLFE